MNGRKLKNDIILAASVLCAALLLFAVFLLAGSKGDYVAVIQDGKETARYSLSENAEIPIYTGDDVNILIIRDGKAYVSEASCPDKICVKHRAIQYNGEAIICLPHRLAIKIVSSSESEVDAVS